MATACRSKGGDIMTVKEKLTKLLEDSPQLDVVGGYLDYEDAAEYLISNGVTVLPEGAIILTKEERAALNEYQKKLDAGGDPFEKE